MAAKGQSYAERSSRWEVLVVNARPEVAEMPHIEEDLTALEEKVQEVRTLGSRQDDLRAQSRELTVQIQGVLREGEKIRGASGCQPAGQVRLRQRGAGEVRLQAASRPPAPPDEGEAGGA